ncbi:MAG: SsrA-binding protein [Candidatus Doudnabacteria bacterium RIFCSPHIGHO2_01_FULL_43_23]|uniref:SsrA-binding protein n=1 Tax=Candidatus Doudnabacteria bacterium RIFCSPHIGHO2_01_FULL_43_23 TaxID=1817822 RepID=A0A1F5NWQ3_9BACT|nr:MAG: SsrA-binding protein [Candidatus Doudnabacteria bacterium RIFCSPHIGHO2_01_FULL_43_23]
MKILTKNRRAFFDYEITDQLEAGIVLTGQEVKSVKTGGVSLDGSYARIARGQASLINAHIKAYAYASNLENYDPTQTRKLLLHKREIKKLENKTSEKGLTLIPLEVYVKNGYIKIRLGLGRSKKKTDKRETIKKRESDRRIKRAIRSAIK